MNEWGVARAPSRVGQHDQPRPQRAMRPDKVLRAPAQPFPGLEDGHGRRFERREAGPSVGTQSDLWERWPKPRGLTKT